MAGQPYLHCTLGSRARQIVMFWSMNLLHFPNCWVVFWCRFSRTKRRLKWGCLVVTTLPERICTQKATWGGPRSFTLMTAGGSLKNNKKRPMAWRKQSLVWRENSSVLFNACISSSNIKGPTNWMCDCHEYLVWKLSGFHRFGISDRSESLWIPYALSWWFCEFIWGQREIMTWSTFVSEKGEIKYLHLQSPKLMIKKKSIPHLEPCLNASWR